MLATGGGGRSSQKNFPDIQKKFSGYSTFFRKYEYIFTDIAKIFLVYDIFHGNEKIFQFSKVPFGQKMQS